MRFIGVLLMFGGYLLIYAATARGGKLATEPWAGLYADAYLSGDTPLVAPAPVGGTLDLSQFPQLSPTFPSQLSPHFP